MIAIQGTVVFAIFLAAAAGLLGRDGLRASPRWLMVAAAVAGNILLVASKSTVSGLIGILLLVGGIGALVVSGLGRRRQRRGPT